MRVCVGTEWVCVEGTYGEHLHVSPTPYLLDESQRLALGWEHE